MRFIKQIFKSLTGTLHQSWGVVMLSTGIIIGTVLGVVFRINYFNSPIWIALVIIIFILMYLKPRFIMVGLCLIAGMVLAFFRVAGELTSQDYVRQFYGLNIVVSGVIDGDPETDEGVTKVKIKELKFGDEKGVDVLDDVSSAEANNNPKHAVGGSLYLTLNKNEDLRRGDALVLGGKLSEGFGTYIGHMYRPELIKILKPDPGNWVVGVRDWFAERVRGLVPEKEAQLGLSYLLGMKTGLDDELSENLRVVGLTHIVVASGAHLSILVEIARKIFGKLSRFAGLMFSIMFIVFFMAMVGWTPSILRAGMMAIVTLISWYVGRKIAPLRMILMVAAVTLMMEPMFLLNLGWLLSFASYAGIMLIGPGLNRFFYGERKPGFIASMVITTLAATLMTLPVILYYYGQVSLISVVANLLILPTLSYAMGLVFLTGLMCGVPGLENLVGFLTEKMLDFHIFTVGILGELKQFLVSIEPYRAEVFLIYVIVLAPLVIGWLVKMVKKRGNKAVLNMETE